MDPLMPRRHTESQSGRDLVVEWSPLPGPARVVPAVVVERPETWPSEGESVDDEVMREVLR